MAVFATPTSTPAKASQSHVVRVSSPGDNRLPDH
jgi:hypothetical protein